MVAMPYILVDFVLGILSLLFFCITSAALLSAYPPANVWLPAQLKDRKALAFVAQGLLLSILAALAIAAFGKSYILSPSISDLLFFIGLINSVVLAYRFLDKRYFLNKPKLQRRLLLGTCSVVMTFVPAFAIVIAVVGLFTIR
jgi:hypothetical protein